ncbi:hypothetical protein QBC35DRAFT_440184 [Podospora australis]|uniref:Uncharacterized protein n=1 Tax=Podospora australis TaxID=1536484 RepID=A0AAN6WNG2_9PEZI|nr:hypothetical protein QBC35DRAFT_440184 [Podospora australis]
MEDRMLANDEDIRTWLQNTTSNRRTSCGFASLLAPRHASRSVQLRAHNPANLRYLPFSREAFVQITKELPLHGDTVRVISRTDVPFFEEINLVDSPISCPGIYYCCRTSATWAGDMAVSSVFYPDTGFTAAVIFGCSDEVSEGIAARIENSEDAWTHPMLIMGIIAEIERERHMKLVQEHVFNLLQRVRNVSNAGIVSASSQLSKEDYSVNLWISVSQLSTSLKTWKKQLLRMEEHTGELERDLFGTDKTRTPSTKKDDWKLSARKTGRKIQKRLKEIVNEYEEKSQECSMVIDGMTVSAQLSWNQIGYQDTQTNLKIATATRQDSNQMRSIAFLTMIFLPATFLSSLFSTTFFNWSPSDDEKIVSSYFWVYPVLAVPITAVVVVCWYCTTRRRIARNKAPLNEKLID